jgi:hypothetical protein
MTSPTSAHAAESQLLGSMHEARSEDGAATARSCRWQSLEINTLRRRWHAAAGPQKSVPPFEELALTTPGGLAENVALLQVDGDGELKISTAGQAFEAWIGRPARGLKVAELSIDRARALQELHDELARPVQMVVYGVVDGLVCVYDLVAVPLSNRRELSLCMVYIEERERNFSLVEAMFQATKDGLGIGRDSRRGERAK